MFTLIFLCVTASITILWKKLWSALAVNICHSGDCSTSSISREFSAWSWWDSGEKQSPLPTRWTDNTRFLCAQAWAFISSANHVSKLGLWVGASVTKKQKPWITYFVGGKGLQQHQDFRGNHGPQCWYGQRQGIHTILLLCCDFGCSPFCCLTNFVLDCFPSLILQPFQ